MEKKRQQYTCGMATALETESAIEIINSVMGVTISTDDWEWFAQIPNVAEAKLAVAKNEGAVLATMACYPRKAILAKNGSRDTLFFGQLCARKASSMRTKGPATGLFQWLVAHYGQNTETTFIIGLLGERIFEVFYRKRFGASRTKTSILDMRYADIAWCAEELQRFFSQLPTQFPGKITLKLENCLRESICIIIGGECKCSITANVNNTMPITLEGAIWPFVRYVSERRAKKPLIRALLKRHLRIKNVWLHPISGIKFLFFVRQIHRSLAGKPNGE